MDLHSYLARRPPDYRDTAALGHCLRALVEAGLDQLPLPGSGRTLERFQRLAEVGGHDLGLCKLYEGHTDALAIIEQLGGSPTPGSTWGMWAAEPPQARVQVRPAGHMVRLDGRKAWCSGAAVLSHALLTAWDAEDRQQLVAVALDQPGVTITDQGWQAVGMGATGSVEVLFDGAEAQAIGEPGDYLNRPGFWQGGIGIAACWYGAARRSPRRCVNTARNVRSRTPSPTSARSMRRCTQRPMCCVSVRCTLMRIPKLMPNCWPGVLAPWSSNRPSK